MLRDLRSRRVPHRQHNSLQIKHLCYLIRSPEYWILKVLLTAEHCQDCAGAHQDLLVVVSPIFLKSEYSINHLLLDDIKTNFRSFEYGLDHLEKHDDGVYGLRGSEDLVQV